MKSKITSNFRRRWKWLLLVIVLIGGAGFWYFRQQATPKEELTFVRPERGNLVKKLEVSGSVTAKEYAKMRFAAGGKVTQLNAQEGDWIAKGKTIAVIDQRSLQKNLQKSLNEYSQERIDWDQTGDNTKDRVLPKTEDRTKQKEQIDLENTVLDVEINSIAITNTVLTAPFDGILVSSPTNVTGITLLATDVFEVVNPNSLYFQAQVDELDIGQIHAGQEAQLTFDAYPDEFFSSSVRYISYKSSQTSTSTVFLVELPVTQPDLNKFRLGLNGDATITLETKENILSIPLDATIEKEGKTFVKLKNGTEEPIEKEIQPGMETDDRIEVVSGLTENDEVLLPN
jgi:RND family efflux transporter MFP subunit